jgi:hypothetical protein
MEYFLGTVTALVLIGIVYKHSTFEAITNCYRMWLTKEYWTNYNIVEAASWFTKAIIIVPGLIFGIQIWWLFFFALATSMTLIWASNKKLLPTLVAFNSLWIWISCMVIFQNIWMMI